MTIKGSSAIFCSTVIGVGSTDRDHSKWKKPIVCEMPPFLTLKGDNHHCDTHYFPKVMKCKKERLC